MGAPSIERRRAAIDALLASGPDAADWRPRLRGLQTTWRMLLDSDDPRAETAIRFRLAHAVAFAGCSIHVSVTEHERYYAGIRGWIRRTLREHDLTPMLPAGAGPRLPIARDAVETGLAWARSVSVADVRAAYRAGRLADLIQDNVHGLGPAKAPFAAACAGDPEAACIDTHGLVDILGYTFAEAERRRNGYRGLIGRRRYAADVLQAFGAMDRAYKQWARFADLVPAFTRSGHAVYFDSVGIPPTATR